MVKKQKKHETLVIEIEQDVADTLGITKKSDIEMVVMDDMLIVMSKKKKKGTAKKKNNDIVKLANRLMDKYEPVLKKLAKT